MLLLLVACSGPSSISQSDTADTAETTPEPAPGLVQDGVVTCADPTLRATLGPMVEADIAGEPIRGAGLVVADLSGDGNEDIFLPNFSRCQLFLSQPDGTLLDVSPTHLPDSDRSCDTWAASAADADGDGDLDLFLARNSDSDQLFLNDGTGAFTNASASSGLGGGRGSRSGSWGDLDGDGDLDLFVSRHHVVNGTGEEPVQPNSLLENNGDATFTDRSAMLSEAATDGYTFLGAWLDVDGDADEDLYILNDFGFTFFPNLLLRNEDGELYEDTEDAAGLGMAIEAMGLGVGDLNDDGLPDMVITDQEAMHLLISDGGQWYDAAASRGLRPGEEQHAAWGVAMVDMDNDGLLDIPVVFGPPESGSFFKQPDALWLQSADGTFTDRAAEWELAQTGNGRGMVTADLNDDGWLDIIKTDYLGGPASAYMSRCGAEGWLMVRIVGSGANTHGVGSRITVRAGDRRWTGWLTAGSTSMASSGPLEVHFGLGMLDRIDSLTVAWPGGGESTFTGIPTRQVLTIHQSEALLDEAR